VAGSAGRQDRSGQDAWLPQAAGGWTGGVSAGADGAAEGITLAEIRATLIERGVASVSLMTIWAMLKRLDLSDEIESLRAAEQNWPDVAAHRGEWRGW
jgi:hypothetical protein